MSLIEATPADWATVPAHLHEGIRRWVDEGVMPGRFLQEVIRNDLKAATQELRLVRVQTPNPVTLFNAVEFFIWCCPAACWQSPAALRDWPAALREMHSEAS